MTPEPILILTPTARLARAHEHARALERQVAGELAWHAAPVMPFPSWLTRLRDDWFLTAQAPAVPISAAQALVLWQGVIDRDVFIGEPRVAEMVAASWRTLHEYAIAAPAQWSAAMLSEDSRRFQDWCRRFVVRCEERGFIDEWRFAGDLPRLIAAGQVTLPECIRLAGFELPLTPLQLAILDAAAAAGCAIERDGAEAPGGAPATLQSAVGAPAPERVKELVDHDAELMAAARWARACLEAQPEQRIGIVVPRLREHLDTVERCLRKVFDPGSFALEARRHEPWHISLGPALGQRALVADALAVIRMDPQRISQPEARALLRSPFLADWDDEAPARARALNQIIGYRAYWIDAEQLAREAGEQGAEDFAARLGRWARRQRDHRDTARPSTWIARFQQELEAIGFGRGRALDSCEYQVLQRFHDLLEEFSALDVVSDRPLSRSAAARQLAERAGRSAFRERNPGAPVEILGVEEALGSRFDALWITGLDNETWPAPTRRDPFIPAHLQAEVPAATAPGALERARAELAGLMRGAPHVVGSFSRGGDNHQRCLAPLLGDVPMDAGEPARVDERQAPVEKLAEDTRAPTHPGGEVRGGTAVLQHQSDCPFRAFAEHRLGAEELRPPRPGLDARDRGSLLHAALEHLWRDVDGLAALEALGEDGIASRIDAANDAALAAFTEQNPLALTEAGLAIEGECLRGSLTDWVAIERQRHPFTVTAVEQRVDLDFAGLKLTGKIDRIDEVEGGGALIIDYKTGNTSRNGWAPDDRLADVQLPAYAQGLAEPPVALAFALLKPDRMTFDGLAEVDLGTPNLEVIGNTGGRSRFRDVRDWTELTDHWRRQLDELASEFLSGTAAVLPREKRVCDYCHLQALCRIHERKAMEEDEA